MNDQGDFYIGNLKIEAGSTSLKFLNGSRVGVDDVFTLPTSATFDDLTADISFQSNGDTEVIDLLLRGNRSGDINQGVYVGIQGGNNTPTSSVDQILFRTSHDAGGYIGWVKTGTNWKRFGPISKSGEVQAYEFDTLQVAGVSTFSGNIDANGDVDVDGDIDATGTTTADTFVGKGTIPIGGIIMWSGADNAVPSNWALCDGSNGTPNLVDRFIVGRGSAYGQGQTGGEATKTLGTANLPSHTHTDGTLSGSGGAHSHGITDNGHFHYMFRSGNAGANQNQGASNLTTTNFPKSGTGPSKKYEGYNIWGTGDAPDVGKNATATTGISINQSSGFTMDISGNTGDQGGPMGQAFENLPPYYAIAYIMRIS